MPKAVYIKINDSGGDIGPYDLTLIDGSNNETPWSGNPVTKIQLLNGYQLIVNDSIVKVQVKSKTCTSFVLLTIPTTQCPCRKFNFTNGSYSFFECGRTVATNLNVSASTPLTYCIDGSRPVTKLGGIGNFVDTLECCSPNTPPVITPTTTSTTTTTSSTTTSTTSTSTTSTTSTTTTTTICEPTLSWGIFGEPGFKLKITRVNDGAVLIDQSSTNAPHLGVIPNLYPSTTYIIETIWTSGSKPVIMRICDITNSSEFSIDSGVGAPGLTFSRTVTVDNCKSYGVKTNVALPTPSCP